MRALLNICCTDGSSHAIIMLTINIGLRQPRPGEGNETETEKEIKDLKNQVSKNRVTTCSCVSVANKPSLKKRILDAQYEALQNSVQESREINVSLGQTIHLLEYMTDEICSNYRKL